MDKVNQIESIFIQMIQKEQHKSNMKQINKKIETNYVELDKLIDYFEKHYLERNRNHLVLAH